MPSSSSLKKDNFSDSPLAIGLRGIANEARRRGIIIKPYEDVSAEAHFLNVRMEQKFLAGLFAYLEIIATPFKGTQDKAKSLEIEQLSLFLKKANLDIKDPHFADFFDEGDLLEVIDLDSTPIYRNIDFFKHSSYSLEDLLVKSWQDLHEQSPAVRENIKTEFTRVMKGNQERVKLEIDAHTIKEKGAAKKIYKVNFKFAWPLYTAQGTQKTALLISKRTVEVTGNALSLVGG